MAAKLPRGISNANPGNLRHGSPWQGLRAAQTDPDFCQFASPAYGIRALAVVLITYQDKHGINTIEGIIKRWAPPVENNTDAYVNAVSADAGIPPTKPLNLHDFNTLLPVVTAIIRHENGQQPYTKDQLAEGLKLAGVVANKPTIKTPVGAATATAGVTGLVAAAMEGSQQVSPVVSALSSAAEGTAGFGQYLRIAGALLVVLSIAASAFAYWRHARQVKA